MSSSRPTAENASPHVQRLSIAAAEELRQTVRTALTDLIGKFLKQFTVFVTQSSEKALNPTDKQIYYGLARGLLADTPRWTESFVQHVDAHLIGGVAPPRGAEATPAAPASADESVALAKIELQAEARYSKLVMEVDARVNRLRLMLYVPVYTKALAPAGMCRSLNDVADVLAWPAKQRKMLFEQFDRMVIPELEGFYKSLIDALTRLGAEAVKATAESMDNKAPAKRPRRSATQMQPPPTPPTIDDETTTMLQNFALKADGSGYTDGLLAADLLALSDKRPLPGIAAEKGWVPLQRMTLASHFLNEVIADPMVPDELKPHHESMRFPLVKSALTDESLFTSGTHPLASMVNELLLKSATSRVTGNLETRRMADLLQQVLVQFDMAPEFVRQSINDKPIEDSQIERFFELQRQQAQQRRDFVVSEAKRIVARQIENATFGRGTPDAAIKFLNGAWGPVLTKRLLQHGANHAITEAGTTLMEQMLDMLDARDPEEAAPQEWKELTMTMVKALIAEGLPPEQVKIALMTLEAARKTPIL